MIRKRTILSLALLATTAACGGGGGGGTSSVPAASAGGTPSSANMPSTNFSSPSAVIGADGTTTMSADQTSQTWTQTGAGTDADPTTLHVHINSGGVAYDGTYDLTHVDPKGPTNPFFANNNFQQANGTDGTNVVFDVTLSHSAYGLWTGPAGQQAVFAYANDPTPVDKIPTSGSATYNGGAIGTGQTNGNGFSFIGNSAWTVGFAGGTVNGTISGTVQDASGNQAPLAFTYTGSESSGKISATGSSTSPTSPIVPTAQTAQATAVLAGIGTNGAPPPELVGVSTFQGGKTTGVIGFGGTAAH